MTIIDLGLGNISNTTAFVGKLSASANVSGLKNREGIISVEISFSTNASSSPKFSLQQSLGGTKWDDVRDNDGAAIEVTITNTTAATGVFTATFVNVHTSYVRIKGTSTGVGIISGIKILAK